MERTGRFLLAMHAKLPQREKAFHVEPPKAICVYILWRPTNGLGRCAGNVCHILLGVQQQNAASAGFPYKSYTLGLFALPKNSENELGRRVLRCLSS